MNHVNALPRVSAELSEALSKLPTGVERLAYLVDAGPDGSDVLVVYIVMGAAVDTTARRSVEKTLREALAKVFGYEVSFRWRLSDEHERVATKGGLIDRPVAVSR
jgi:hypothetical protein